MKLPFRFPTKFFVLVIAGSIMFFGFLPKRAQQVGDFLAQLKAQKVKSNIRESIKDRILKEVCSPQDLCIYKPVKWSDDDFDPQGKSNIEHTFYINKRETRYLFRLIDGEIEEMYSIY